MLDTCKIMNSLPGAIDVTLTKGMAYTVTYMCHARLFDVEAGTDIHWADAKFPVLIHRQNPGMVQLHMYHGRDRADENLDDWGFDGPCLTGALAVIEEKQLTMYHADGSSTVLAIDGDLLAWDGKFYGDFSIDRLGDDGKVEVTNFLSKRDGEQPLDLDTLTRRLAAGKPLNTAQAKRAGEMLAALALVQTELDGTEWSAETCGNIAGYLDAAGLVVKELNNA